MRIKMRPATSADTTAIAELRTAVAEDLTSRFGKGHWSSAASVKGVTSDMKSATVLVASNRNKLIGTLRLATKKPWAIDTAYFAACHNPLYLTNMAVAPALQSKGIGRACIDSAVKIAQSRGETGRVAYRNVPLIYFELMLGELK
jgi:ribosomal protein S18 acetylase RimI-like enzyme